MTMRRTGNGEFTFTPAAAQNLSIVLSGIDENSFTLEELQSPPPPSSLPTAYNGKTITWLIHFVFTNKPAEANPSFQIRLPKVSNRTYVYYEPVEGETSPGSAKPLDNTITEDANTVTFQMNLADPSVGMT